MCDIIPVPRALERLPGRCDLGKGFVGGPSELFGAEAEYLFELIEDARRKAGSGSSSDPSKAASSAEGSSLPFVRFSPDASLPGDEEYRLSVGPEGVEVTARHGSGAFRAATTLRQLLLSEGPSLPALRIEDGPRFPWRGFMLDTVRSFFPVEFLERMIDLAALHKLSVFHWHLTDDQAWRLDIPKRPEIGRFGSTRSDRRFNPPSRIDGLYSAADARRIVAFAAARHILVVPEIETPGHATALLASHPELSCRGAMPDGAPFVPESRYGVFEEILCAGNDSVFELLADVYDEVATIFPGPYVHAGGDEAPKARWDSCPRCKARMKALALRDEAGALDSERLQAWFMGRVAELLAERGKRLVGWDEILEGGPRKDAIVMSWRGIEGGIAAAKAGHEVVMSPQTHACYLDHRHGLDPDEPGRLGFCSVRDSYEFEPVPSALSEEEGKRIIGGQANLWTEIIQFGRQAEYMAFPRLCALSEVFWSMKDKRDFGDFSRRLTAHGERLDALGVNRYRGALE